jgi:hypothetical protein
MPRWLSKFSSGVGLASLCLISDAAIAGACCTGSTTTVPTRLGECETAIAAIGTSVEASYARWDSSWRSTSSSLKEQAIITTIGGAWRWDRKGQVAVTMPFLVNHKDAGTSSVWGGGVGDLRAFVLYDPVTEAPSIPGEHVGSPVPVFTAGVRLPTGRSWENSGAPLQADVTGLVEFAMLASVQIERTLDRAPWSVSVGTEIGIGPHGVQPTLMGSAAVGAYIGRRWSFSGTLRHTSSWTPLPELSEHSHAASTAAGARLTVGQMLKWRAWAGVEVDLPGLGRDRLQRASGSLGVALVR